MAAFFHTIESFEMSSLRKFASDPAAFRDALRIDADGRAVAFGEIIEPWQQADFAALDPAWQAVAGRADIEPPHRRAWLERPRGHAKTSDLAVMAVWAVAFAPRPLAGVAAAADRDQARLLRDAIARLARLNDWLAATLDVQAYRVVNSRTGSTLEILSSDAPTSYGLTPDFVVADELVHWQSRDLWDSILSASAKRKHCVLNKSTTGSERRVQAARR
ncbi:MAG: hypothetical protein D6760_02805 [Deltaproteobacteria bacterium]|nr:MAG: hypothetical protein D6760_02805 [Deltaproteobacteria bacterium]